MKHDRNASIFSSLAGAAALILACGLVAPASAQAPVTVSGVVVNTAGTPVADATVAVEPTGMVLGTDPSGRFRLGLEPGRYVVRVQRLGYAPARVELDVGVNGVAPLTIMLEPHALALGALTVIGTDTEFEEVRERMRSIPGSVTLIGPAELRGTRQANFKDVLRMTPGVFAQPRYGAADETQLSIRGSGLRNNFHLRGVNVLVNGMPYRNADGFTDFEALELLAAENVQVYKGANAFRYGGATIGGAVNIETKTGYTAAPMSLFAEAGAAGFLKAQASSGGVHGPLDYYASYARTQLDGFRSYSDQTRDRLNAHIGWVISPSLDARAFYLFADVHEELPGALTRAEFETDPAAAAPANVADRYGRDYRLHHLGLQFRAQLAPGHRIDVSPYVQYRDIVHPIFRVLDQISRDVGVEARYQGSGRAAGLDHAFAAGVQAAYGNTDNRHFENLGGAPGALRKDQRDEADALALYAEDRLDLGGGFSLVGGLRWSRATRSIEDRYLDDGDQSGTRAFTALLPRVGALLELGADAQLYANASRAYEPPLLLELNSLAVPGFVALDAQDAWQFELGTRGALDAIDWDIAVYDMRLRNEILNENVEPFEGAGFTVPAYRNVARTEHAGVEAGIGARLASGLLTDANGGDELSVRAAYTYSRFRFTSDADHEGNLLPGAPEHTLGIELEYRHPRGFSVRPTIEWVVGDYFADSANTVANDGWFTVGTRLDWALARLDAAVFIEARNLTDAHYSPAVVVDDAAGRHFLPADGRALYLGFRWER